TIDRLDFSTDTITTPAPKLSQARYISSAFQINRNPIFKGSPKYTNWPESATTGYFAGGSTPTPVGYSNLCRMDFSTETTQTPEAKLSSGKSTLAAVSSSSYG
ncbi:MAG: hypothetical protein ACKO96_38385, partial [Flammeovirgaceae bacterium]